MAGLEGDHSGFMLSLHGPLNSYAVMIHYIGPGKKDTGDWCFADGFITFKDITDAYMECFQSKCLEITSDCSYSGRWVSEYRVFMDSIGVKPCAHSGREKNVLLAVWASCKSHEISHTLLYSVRGMGNDKNTGALYEANPYEVGPCQNGSSAYNTEIKCKKGIHDQCALKPNYTWQEQGAGQRTFLIRKSNESWYYLQVVDDDETLCKFIELSKSGQFNPDNYGQKIRAGLGRGPLKEVQEEMECWRHGIEK